MAVPTTATSVHHRRRALAVTVLATLAIATLAGGVWWQQAALPRRFAEVDPGRLYRSGEVAPHQLVHLQRDYHIGRIVSLLAADAPVTVAERQAAERLGIEWCNVPLRGNGASTAEDRRQILTLLADPNAPPTLVHCAAGANRTGLAVGLYRLHCQGWSLASVLDEMRTFGFEDLPKHENLRAALATEAAAAQPANGG